MKPPEIREFVGKRLFGLRRRMSIAEDRTSELWREFRAKESRIVKRIGDESYSVKVYAPEYSFTQFEPHAEFDKWAAVELDVADNVAFETLEIPAGLYAVFIHTGPAVGAPAAFGHIFGTWLPNSGFDLDKRPHFEILPADYSPFDPNAEEEIWVPVRQRR